MKPRFNPLSHRMTKPITESQPMVFAPYLKAKKPSPIETVASVKMPAHRPAKGRRPKIDPLPALGVEFKETSDE